MQTRYFKEYSKNLQRDMEFKVYGTQGKPALVFPSQDGRFYQYEDFGMVEACRQFIDEGRLQLFCVDSIDEETWSAEHKSPRERIVRHEQYVKYILNELIPRLQSIQKQKYAHKIPEKLLFSGVSMGAAHAANFFFRFAPLADSLIALSGMYDTKHFLGEYMDEDVYFNSAVHYLSNLEDQKLLDHYRQSKIVICTGQGAFEDIMVCDTKKISCVLERKSIPAWIDFWGFDVNHDWEWWRKQMPYFLSHVL